MSEPQAATVRVYLRVDLDGEPFAILPDDREGNGDVGIFCPVGGHTAGPLMMHLDHSKPAPADVGAYILRAMSTYPGYQNLEVLDTW